MAKIFKMFSCYYIVLFLGVLGQRCTGNQIEEKLRREYPQCSFNTLPDGSLYYFYAAESENQGYNYDKSQEFCKEKCGMKLASIKSKEQSDAILDYYYNQARLNYWWWDQLGMEYINIWLGGERTGENEFKWDNTTNFSFNNWAPNRPRKMEGRQCVGMVISKDKGKPFYGKWFNTECEDKRAYMCSF